jgi:tyrosyl-tRNA synthetase
MFLKRIMKNGSEEVMKSELTEVLLKKGVQEILPSSDFLSSGLSKKRLKVYAGIDPTGPTLHIGHIIVLRKLRQFQELGHQIVLLIGDFTATIGDPTDKSAVRKVLTAKEVKKNLTLYKKQASRFINFSGSNKATIVYNSKWLKRMDLKDILDLSSLMTVDQMMKRDMFSVRQEVGKPIFIHEFLYPLMQGYDSVMLDVDVEIGGNDQMFNMMVGRDFQKKINNKEKVCITMKLLTDTTGKKMGKSEGNMVSLLDSNFEMFGKIMSWTDGMIVNGFELCTDFSLQEIENIKNDIEKNISNPRDLKIRLAYEVVKIYHGEQKANEAKENFINTFSKKETPENIAEVFIPVGTPLSMVLLNEKLVKSTGEFKRLVSEKAITTFDEKIIDDFNYKVEYPMVVKVGKRRFLDIKIS